MTEDHKLSLAMFMLWLGGVLTGIALGRVI